MTVLETQLRATGIARFRKAWRAGHKRRVKRTIARWAREVRKIVGGPIADAYAQGGAIAFSTEYIPHTVSQMEAADDPTVQIVAIWGPRRDAKTTLALNAIGRCVTDSPGGCYSVHPVINDADMFSENELESMIQNSPQLAPCFVEKRSRDSGRTKSYKKFKGGFIRIISGDSITAFRGTTVKVLHIPEADAANLESIYKAMGRTDGLRDAIVILESTGTNATETGDNGKLIFHSVIAEHYHYSDQQKWFCACQSCGHLQTTKYKQIRTATASFADARYHCEACDFAHDEAAWYEFAKAGRWYPTAGLTPEQLDDIANTFHLARAIRPEIRGFWRNAFASLFPVSKGFTTKLHEFLAKGEAAKSSPESLKIWMQEVACELWDSQAIGEPAPEWKPLMDRAEPYATKDGILVPSGALVITGGGDVHPDRIEWTWLAWGRGETCWILDHVVTLGDTRDHSKTGPWLRFHQELQRTFEHASGGDRIGLELGMLDAGYGWDDVLKFLQTQAMLGKLRACRGSTQYPAPVVGSCGKIVTGRPGQGTLNGHFVGTDAVKDTLYSRLRLIPTPDGLPDGWIHFGQNLPESFFQQLTAEKVEIVSVNGREERRYRKKAMARNETLDTWVYGYASFRRRQNWDWAAIEALRMREKPPEKKSRFRHVPGIL